MIPLTLKSIDRIKRVQGVGHFSSRNNWDSTVIHISFNFGGGGSESLPLSCDLPDATDLVKSEDYAVAIENAKTQVGSGQLMNFLVVVCLIAFGTRKNVMVLVEYVPVEGACNGNGRESFWIVNKCGQQFKYQSSKHWAYQTVCTYWGQQQQLLRHKSYMDALERRY